MTVMKTPSRYVMSRRRISNLSVWILCAASLAFVILPALWIVADLARQVVPHWHFSVLTQTGTGLAGGLENEIVGTAILVFGVLLFAGTIGVLSGIYLSEYSNALRGSFLRTASEVLAGVPSITLGYVGYISLVVYFHWGYSLGAGLVVLSVMVIPYIAKATELSMRQVPSSYKEGAEALGMKEAYILRKITLKHASPGIATGLIIACAIAVGETAPLLYTAGYSQSLPKLALTHHPLGYLTYAVWTFYNEPSQAAHQLSLDAAGILIFTVVVLILMARTLVFVTQRHNENR